MSELSVPTTNSNPRDFALPIWVTLTPTVGTSVPRTLVGSLYKLTCLNAWTSPETNPISGEP